MANTQEKSNSNKGLLRNNESTSSEIEQPDFSNGFENRIVDFDYRSQDRNINVCSHFIPTQDNKYATLTDSLKSVIHRNSPKLSLNQTDDAHSSVEKLSQQFTDHSSQQDNTQNVPLLQTQQLHFIPEAKEEFSNFSNIRSQFEIRSQMFQPQQKPHFERACYVTSTEKINNIYRNENPHYVNQKLSPQSTSPKPPYYSSGVIPPPLEQRFVRQPQYSYNSCPETVVNAYIKEQTIINPYNVDIYSTQNPAKHQRFLQDLTQYQMQHVAAAQATNQNHQLITTKDKTSRRGPKPMVPPRGNSKITYDAGNKTQIINNTQHYQQGPSNFSEKNNTLTSSASQSTIIDADNKFIQRTRQDGLLEDLRSHLQKENTEPVYVSKLENRKSIDVAISQKNNFTDPNSELHKFDRKTTIDIKNDLNPLFSTEGKNNLESIKHDGSTNRLEDIRKSPMLFVPIRETLLERGNQKSPSFQDQQFEKTRQELSAWAEQRQRQDERGIQYFGTRTRNEDEKLNHRKEMRILPPIHPVPDISQNVLLEQRRHLRHVSADLTKHIEFTNKEFDHSISGSVSNLVPTTNVVWVQKSNPLYNQYPAHSETKIDSDIDKTEKPFHQIDHIIHSHRKSHLSSNLSTYGNKNQSDKDSEIETTSDLHQKQFQQHQSLDYLSNKLKQCEIQQSDLHAKLQCLQNQNQFLDKVAQFQNRDIHTQFYLIKNKIQENYPDHLTKIQGTEEEFLYQQQKGLMNQNLLPSAYSLTSQNPYDRLSPRLQQQQQQQQQKEIDDSFSSIENTILYPSQSQIDVNYSSRRSFNQLNRLQDPINKVANLQYPSVMMPTGNIHITGTLKKIPPEKPPRTSLIMQNPEIESQNPIENAEAKEATGNGAEMYLNPNPGIISGGNSNLHVVRENDDIDKEHALVYRDGNLVSGSLEALIQHMVPTAEYYPDQAYLFSFLLSARLFIKPHELLGEVCALCESQQNLSGENGKEKVLRFVHHLVQLLAEWTGIFPYDFRDERMMSHVKSITQKIAAVDAGIRQEVSNFLQNLLLRLTALERYEEGLARLAKEPSTEQLTQIDLLELCPSATILAQQLTHVELERLSYIGPEEFVQAFAKELPHLETSFKEMKKTRNLESYAQWFNRLSYFVATEVSKHIKKKQRVRVVEYWIETARECFNFGNFNSLMAIIAGLNMSPITRLKKTWAKVQTSKFAILEHQMDPSSNFSSYRSTLKAAMWRSAGATDEQQRIVIPFFSLLVKDLYFLNEGCSNKLPNGHINFEKFWQLAKQVTEFLTWKQVVCPFEKDSRVIAFLQASPILTENALSLASFECEPPDTNHEKERYKTLKAEHSM
ncbi:uncharacterized protein LOC127276881 [Leptopilina boulardi]|uniref:uncharacterized protein LOC127276881 n=1 Tax=Leptopilina boulardi TaxID=63433 RepID=UPI0021F6307C|nr:uncharacterized protein LOC127276881 [Leptopilina boulardi]